MKRPFFTITQENFQFRLELKDIWGGTLLCSKLFATYRECERFLQTLKMHLCFQTNFSRSKTSGGGYSFQIRTCWDELIGESISFVSRAEREAHMELVMQANKNAVFLPFYTDIEKAA